MREHNRLTRAYREREVLIKNSQQQKKFKKNPMKFGKELFQKKTVGEPSFSSQVALDYFAGLYKDEKRDHTFTPLPICTPSHVFRRPSKPKRNHGSFETKTKRCCTRSKWDFVHSLQKVSRTFVDSSCNFRQSLENKRCSCQLVLRCNHPACEIPENFRTRRISPNRTHKHNWQDLLLCVQ